MNLGTIGLHARTWSREVLSNTLFSSYAVPRPLRVHLLRSVGVVAEYGSAICAGFKLHGHSRLTIGRHVFINYECFVDLNAPVLIGDNVSIGYRTQLITASHEIGPSQGRAGRDRAAPITIGNGVWIGAGSVVLPGVEIGEGCVIGAGSVVTSSCRPNTLYAGVPAVAKRRLEAGELTTGETGRLDPAS
jgi:maltose O-acetyltransferase